MVSESRKALKSALRSYQSEFTSERLFKKEMLALLEKPDCFKRELLEAHFTASAWVVDTTFKYALLVHHAKLNRWLQPGGHADGIEDLSAVALKELQEESGLLKVEFLSKSIFDIDIHTIPARGKVPEHRHFDVRYLFMADMDQTISKNHESTQVCWKSLESIPKICNQNDSILRMIDKSRNLSIKMLQTE